MSTLLYTITSLFSIIFISCSDQGWSKEEIESLKNGCEDIALKEQGILKKDSKELERIRTECSCVSDKFTNQFSFEEYTKMTKEPIDHIANPKLSNRVEVYLKTTMGECGIKF